MMTSYRKNKSSMLPDGRVRLLSSTAAMALLALWTTSCGSERKVVESGPSAGRTEGTVINIAREAQLEPRLLLVAAHTQSNFGETSGPALAEVTGRPSYYGMPVSSTGPIDGSDPVANTRLIAQKMSEIGKASSPPTPFDWLVIASNVIVGQVSEDNPNVRDTLVRSVLVELMSGYNEGFTALVDENETITVPPLPENEKILAAKLDERQMQYINGFRFRRDMSSDFFLAGPELDQLPEKNESTIPKVILTWCPASNLVCLEYARRNESTPAHFVVTKGLEGQLETTQFYPLYNDISWHGKLLANTIVISIAGQAGTVPTNFQPNWLDFEEYASLRGIVRNIFNQSLRKTFGSALEADKLLADPQTFRNNLLTLNQDNFGSLGVPFPEGSQPPILPTFWDSTLFWELLTDAQTPRIKEQILVSKPSTGEVFRSTDVPFDILLTDDVRSIELYQDRVPELPGASPWELVIKREVSPERRNRENFTHPFTRLGALAGTHRAVKVVARSIDGKLLATRISRFSVTSLSEK